jgi:pyruvate ferredoxin oxidoreductase gamma subunit
MAIQMYEIRWHGRAGQGIITVSRLLGQAAFQEGKHVQAFPQFGPERLGAPMMGFTRIAEDPIEIHSAVYNPDAIIVLDDSVLKVVNVTEGLKAGGKLLINSKRHASEFVKAYHLRDVKCHTVDASTISFEILGSGRAFNTAMLGAFLKVEPIVSMDSMNEALRKRFRGDVAVRNIEVLKRAYKEVT